MKLQRRKTTQFKIGNVGIGSDFPISVQSMTTTKTRDVCKMHVCMRIHKHLSYI